MISNKHVIIAIPLIVIIHGELSMSIKKHQRDKLALPFIVLIKKENLTQNTIIHLLSAIIYFTLNSISISKMKLLMSRIISYPIAMMSKDKNSDKKD